MWTFASWPRARNGNCRPPKKYRRAIWDIRGKPPFTLVPIAPERLKEKAALGEFFFRTNLTEGVPMAMED